MKRFLKQFTATWLLMIVAILFMATPASAYNVKQTWARFAATAGETLVTGNVVTLKDADGYAWKADANDAALRPAVGVIGKGGAAGAKVEVIVYGILSGWTALTESGPGYLSETAGAITQSAPAYSQQIGFAISTTEYMVNCQNYFDSSSLTVLGTLSGASPIVLEGATPDEFETTIAVADPTADRTVTLANADGTVMLSSLATNAPDVANSIWGISNGLAFGGATGADGFELQVKPMGDPSADKIVYVPVLNNAAAVISTLTTNDVDVANSVWGISNGLAFGGATGADGFELQVKPMGDPSADKSVLIPVLTDAAAMISTLTTNDVDVANSIWGISNGLAFGGATGADGFELQVKPMGDPGADKSVLIPVLNDAAAMISTLTTNDVDVANSVWGVSNGIAFGGASGADGIETKLTITDPTADRTVTIPDATGTVNLNCTASHDYGAAAVDWTLTAAEMQCGAISVTNANAGVNAILPSAIPGKLYTVINGSGQTLTFKVTGQTGGTVATAKWALYTTIAADVAEVYELP